MSIRKGLLNKSWSSLTKENQEIIKILTRLCGQIWNTLRYCDKVGKDKSPHLSLTKNPVRNHCPKWANSLSRLEEYIQGHSIKLRSKTTSAQAWGLRERMFCTVGVESTRRNWGRGSGLRTSQEGVGSQVQREGIEAQKPGPCSCSCVLIINY